MLKQNENLKPHSANEKKWSNRKVKHKKAVEIQCNTLQWIRSSAHSNVCMNREVELKIVVV